MIHFQFLSIKNTLRRFFATLSYCDFENVLFINYHQQQLRLLTHELVKIEFVNNSVIVSEKKKKNAISKADTKLPWSQDR